MTTAYVWVTLVSGSWVDEINGGLVRVGYEVKEGTPGILIQNTEFSTTLCVKLSKEISGENPVGQIRDDVIKLLKNLRASYFNIIMSGADGKYLLWANGVIYKPLSDTVKSIPPGAAAILSDKDEFT